MPHPKRPYAVRKPKDYRPARPGDLVQVETLDVRPLPGVILKHFTARDVVSRCDVLQVGTQATSASAARFLNAIVERMPFPVGAIQVDGGSEFQGAFEEACRERGVLQFGAPAAFAEVERLRGRRTRVEEFYNFYDGESTMGPLNRALREWEARSSTRIGVSRLAGGLRWSILRNSAWRRPPNPPLSHMCRTNTCACRAAPRSV